MKALSLFCGAGGCDLGLRRAGFEFLAAYDNDNMAVATYNRNIGGASCEDLSTCDFTAVMNRIGMKSGELDVMVGGPPCQGFTTAGSRFWGDPRNALVHNYAKALEVLRPRWFAMENVEGILTTARGVYITETVKKMIGLGYSVYIKKIYMQEHSIPQRRKRVFIVGNREGKHFSFPRITTPLSGAIYRSSAATLRSVIEDLEDTVDERMNQIPAQEQGLRLERIQALAQGQSMKDLPERLQHSSFRRRASRRVCDGMPSEKRGGAPSGLKRLIYDEPSLTITSAATNEFVHPSRDRMLTVRECARIQTFPDDYYFCGTDAQQMLQIGNAIPPDFAESLGRSIKQADNTEPGMHRSGLVERTLTKASAYSPALTNTIRMLDEVSQKQLAIW